MELTIGDYLNWAEPKGKASEENACIQCGRKTKTQAIQLMVHASTNGTILPPNETEHPDSQGYWPVGSDCAKAFDPEALAKAEYDLEAWAKLQ